MVFRVSFAWLLMLSILFSKRAGESAISAVKGHIPSFLPGLSVARLIEAGANAIKVVVYYDPDDDQPINSMKQAFIECIGAECDEIFRASLELAAEADTPYSGVLCGRATWQSSITAYAEGGNQALTTWLKQQGVQNIEAVNAILRQGAQPWWNLYGGKDHLDIVDSFSLKRSLKSESGQ
jgi:tagatose-1,6-bisphosphate aldolase